MGTAVVTPVYVAWEGHAGWLKVEVGTVLWNVATKVGTARPGKAVMVLGTTVVAAACARRQSTRRKGDIVELLVKGEHPRQVIAGVSAIACRVWVRVCEFLSNYRHAI